jgi:hypothetical protein
MKQNILKALQNGLYLVLGQGFVGTANQASRLAADAASNAAGAAKSLFGIDTTSEEVENRSFGVNYIRKGDIVNGVVQPNKRNPSKRRFATKEEANQHGSRFQERRLRKGDAKGTANHIGFYVTETTDPVNAAINWATGLTNAL